MEITEAMLRMVAQQAFRDIHAVYPVALNEQRNFDAINGASAVVERLGEALKLTETQMFRILAK